MRYALFPHLNLDAWAQQLVFVPCMHIHSRRNGELSVFILLRIFFSFSAKSRMDIFCAVFFFSFGHFAASHMSTTAATTPKCCFVYETAVYPDIALSTSRRIYIWIFSIHKHFDSGCVDLSGLRIIFFAKTYRLCLRLYVYLRGAEVSAFHAIIMVLKRHKSGQYPVSDGVFAQICNWPHSECGLKWASPQISSRIRRYIATVSNDKISLEFIYVLAAKLPISQNEFIICIIV